MVSKQLIQPSNVVAFLKDPTQRRERLFGVLGYYHREAA
jgi:hypothetical protein